MIHLLPLLSAALVMPVWAQGRGIDGTRALHTEGKPAEWQPIDHDRLDDMRGGFNLPSGQSLSFGIERVAYVNGEILATARVDIPDIGRMTVEQAASLKAINEALVVQIGASNSFDAASGLGGLVVQNALDGQHIRTVTRLNVGVDTLGAFQEANSFGALHNALLTAPGSL